MPVFGATVETNTANACIFAACFLVTLNSSFYDAVVADWHMSYLQNPTVAHSDLLLTPGESRVMFTLQRIVRFLRIIFVFAFLVSQFPFVLSYVAADLIGNLVEVAHFSFRARVDHAYRRCGGARCGGWSWASRSRRPWRRS